VGLFLSEGGVSLKRNARGRGGGGPVRGRGKTRLAFRDHKGSPCAEKQQNIPKEGFRKGIRDVEAYCSVRWEGKRRFFRKRCTIQPKETGAAQREDIKRGGR